MFGSDRSSHATVPVLVILLGLSVAVFTFNTTRSAEESQWEAQFAQNASRFAQRLVDSFAQQGDLLRFLATLYEREADATAHARKYGRFDAPLTGLDLQLFVDPALSTDRRYGPLETVAWVQRIGRDEVTDYERMRRVERDDADFRVHTRQLGGVDQTSVHDVVDQAWSRLSHEHAEGFDLASDSALAETLQNAATSGNPALSLPVCALSDPDDPARRTCLLVAVPIFMGPPGLHRSNPPPPVRGFVVGVFSLPALLDQALRQGNDEDLPQESDEDGAQDVRLELMEQTVVLGSAGRPALDRVDGVEYRTTLFDRNWKTVVFPVSRPALTVDELLSRPSTLLTASICIMMLLFLWIFTTLARRTRVIQQRVGEQTAELRQKNLVLEGKERELNDVNRRLLEMSNTDPLTAILNRRAFEVQLDKERDRAQRTGVPYGLLIFDVDQFKDYNDRYGHAAGDDVLRRVAGIINAEARRIDTVARYGGEEFVVLATGTDAVGLLALGERIRGRIQDAGVAHASAPKGVITVSGGGSLSNPSLGHDPKLAFEVADRCLYQAKSTGRNRVVMVM